MGDVVEGHAGGVAHMGASTGHPDQGARIGVQDAHGSLGRLVVLVPHRTRACVLGSTSRAQTSVVEQLVRGPKSSVGEHAARTHAFM